MLAILSVGGSLMVFLHCNSGFYAHTSPSLLKIPALATGTQVAQYHAMESPKFREIRWNFRSEGLLDPSGKDTRIIIFTQLVNNPAESMVKDCFMTHRSCKHSRHSRHPWMSARIRNSMPGAVVAARRRRRGVAAFLPGRHVYPLLFYPRTNFT